MLTKTVLATKLTDDATPFGGVSFAGETVQDFIDTVGINPQNINDLNEALQECGIARTAQ